MIAKRALDDEAEDEFCESGKCGQETRDQASALLGRDRKGSAMAVFAVGDQAVLPKRGAWPARRSALSAWLRIYFLQQRYGLSDEGLEDAPYDSVAMRAFAGIDLAVENVPDATTLLNFRRLLVEHDLTRKLFDEIGISRCEQGLTIKEGTLVNVTIIEAPSSTKNAEKSRDPEMHR